MSNGEVDASMDKIAVRDALIVYGENDDIYLGEEYFTPDPEADELIKNDPLAFLFGVILDQSWPAEKVWATPLEIKRRLGHLDARKIAKMSYKELEEVFEKPPKLHRFWRNMAHWMRDACAILMRDYEGNAENIWNDMPTSAELQDRFDEFVGIGQKKASMATNILVRDLGVPVKDRSGIDVSCDVHVMRVFSRTGLVDTRSESDVIHTARALNPEYPGALDLPAWDIGRRWCHEGYPDCVACPINGVCSHRK
jgi:uncharacterized HhH-GPD family protein